MNYKSKEEDPVPTKQASSEYDFTRLPDYNNDFINREDFKEFAKALSIQDYGSTSASQDDLASFSSSAPPSLFITALNDWRPIRQRVRSRKSRRRPQRGRDETREGFVYTLLKWPLLVSAFNWLALLSFLYTLTRVYVHLYERFFAWRGQRQKLRKTLWSAKSYDEWVAAARKLDAFLGNDQWKEKDEYAYYDSKTVERVIRHMRDLRQRVENDNKANTPNGFSGKGTVEELRGLVEACVKNNFAGTENPRLYSESYIGTKSLVQGYVDEVEKTLRVLTNSKHFPLEEKRLFYKHLCNNFGRTALCFSGGATFAYYHFGVAKALLDADVLPEVITGTSGGALIAALLCTRSDDELRRLLVPALACRITACQDSIFTWLKRWWVTGARFDSVKWAQSCAWFTRGSLTFREAYNRTGRILNISCVPSDPHSPTILTNYLTSPDCVIWSAVLASAAVPGILNPVVLMKKQKDGTLVPYSFGHKWKDGSLRTDIPLKSLNLHFNVNFSIVSQVNPHINLFFFSPRGTVGRPVTHRYGRGWRGGFLGSAVEQYLKLEMNKWLKVLRHLELLPRFLGQDWSEIWLQRFSGTITIWPKSIVSDFYYILSDPTPSRLARMILVGQQSAFPKLKFICNRMAIERIIDQGRRSTRQQANASGLAHVLSEEDLHGLLADVRQRDEAAFPLNMLSSDESEYSSPGGSMPFVPVRRPRPRVLPAPESPTLSGRLSEWWNAVTQSPAKKYDGSSNKFDAPRPREASPNISDHRPSSMFEVPSSQASRFYGHQRRGSVLEELKRQSTVFFDDVVDDDEKGMLSDEDASRRNMLSDDENDCEKNGVVMSIPGSNTVTDRRKRGNNGQVENGSKGRVLNG